MADMEVSGSNAFVDDTELEGMINASFGLWYQKVASACPERFEKDPPQSITADGSLSYTLPSDYGYTLAVEYQAQSGVYVDLPRISFRDRNKYSNASTSGPAIGYRLGNGVLALLPAPLSGAYRHWYVPTAPVLGDGTGGTVTSFDGVNGWEEWIVYDVAIKMLVKEESDASQLILERAKIEKEVNAAISDRDLMNPRAVVDTRSAKRWAAITPDGLW